MIEWMASFAGNIGATVWGWLNTPAVHQIAQDYPEVLIVAAALYATFAIECVAGVPAGVVAGVRQLRSLRNARSARASIGQLRADAGTRFAVLLAPMDRDADASLEELVGRGVTDHFGAFIFDREVEVARPDISLSGASAADAARALAVRSEADLIVWGVGGGGRGLWRIYFLTAKALADNEPVQEIRVIPPDGPAEARQLAAGVAYVMARIALPCAEEPDRYRADKLSPVLDALDDLLAEPPTGLGPAFESLLREDAARIALSLGERDDDLEALRRASRLRVRLLAEADRATDAAGWAHARKALGEVHLAIGRRDLSARRLDAAIDAFDDAAEELGEFRDENSRADAVLHLAHAHRERARVDQEATHLTAAAKAYRAALKIASEDDPRFIDAARRGLAGALHGLAELSGDQGALEQAVEVYRAASTERSRAVDAVGWAQAQHDLGLALAALGSRHGDAHRLDEAVAAFREALKERTRDAAPEAWAETMNQLGHGFFAIGKNDPKGDALEAAIWAYEEALQERTRDVAPFEWAQTQNNLGNAYHAIGERDDDSGALDRAVECYRIALTELPKDRHPFEWAGTQNNLGNALHVLGENGGGVDALEDALSAHRAALTVRTKERARVDWAASRNNMGLVLTTLGQRLHDPSRLREAADAYRDALGVFRLAGAVRYAVMAERNLDNVREMLDAS